MHDWDCLARVIRAQEALADGEHRLARQLLADLAKDLNPRSQHRCELCGLDFDFPGRLDEHTRIRHPTRWGDEGDDDAC
jgi:hypothetical protein